MKQYQVGQQVFYIDYIGYSFYPAEIKNYEPSTGLYKINYRIHGDEHIWLDDVSADDLITIKEVIKNGKSLNDKPASYQDESTGVLVFTDGHRLYAGHLNFDGKWKDYLSDSYIDDVIGYLPSEHFPPTGMGNASFVDEGESGEDPI